MTTQHALNDSALNTCQTALKPPAAQGRGKAAPAATNGANISTAISASVTPGGGGLLGTGGSGGGGRTGRGEGVGRLQTDAKGGRAVDPVQGP